MKERCIRWSIADVIFFCVSAGRFNHIHSNPKWAVTSWPWLCILYIRGWNATTQFGDYEIHMPWNKDPVMKQPVWMSQLWLVNLPPPVRKPPGKKAFLRAIWNINEPIRITWRIIPFSKWLITMVSKSPNWGCSPYKRPKWLINGGY